MQRYTFMQGTKCCWTVFFCLLVYLPATAQRVENVRTFFDQSKQVMLIYYDLKWMSFKEEVQVMPYIVSSRTQISPIKSLSGDFGWQNRNGANKLIIWDLFKDGIDTFVQIEIKTETREAPNSPFAGVLLNGNKSTPFGVKFMLMANIFSDSTRMLNPEIRLNRLLRNHFGSYASLRMNRKRPDYQYTVSNEGVIDYLESGVYEIGSERRLAGYAFVVGPLVQVSRNRFIYVGLGYGAERLFWKYQAYNLDRNPTGTHWALNESINRKGIVLETGYVFRLRRLLLDIGVSTLQFKSFQITGGIGIGSSAKN